MLSYQNDYKSGIFAAFLFAFFIVTLYNIQGDYVLKCNIGGFCVNIHSRFDFTNSLCRTYADNSASEPLFDVRIGDKFLESEISKNPHLTPDLVEHIYLASDFYRRIIGFGGFLLHSSCILYKGKAYLFSAPSQTGKSTHTRLWQAVFGKENVKIINDDMPLIKFSQGKPFACGTPFAGGTDININTSAPIGAVVFLERAKQNQIERIQPFCSLPLFIEQTKHFNLDKNTYSVLLDMIDALTAVTPVYKLRCNISEGSAILAENTIVTQE